MSSLDYLISKHCPDGVDFVELDDLLLYEQPTKYLVESTDYDDSFKTPVLTAGASFILGYTDEIRGVYTASENEPVIIFDDFTTSFHWVEFDFKVKSSAMKMITERDDSKALIRYVYHTMKNIYYKPTEHARQWIGTYSKFKVPLPPIEIQRKIVQILDKFTTLKTELRAELRARKKQYYEYRQIILNLDSKTNPIVKNMLSGNRNIIEFHEIQDIFDIRNGYTPSKRKKSYWTDGTVPWFRIEDIRKNGSILSDSIQHVTPEGVKGELFPADSIIMSTTATIGEHAIVTTEYLSNQQFTCLSRKEKFQELLDPMFVYYYCYLLGEWCKNNTRNSSFPSVDMVLFRKFKFPIPPIFIQKTITHILTRFDKLSSDVSRGLPAEIDARRKQYEYYCNKLLSFKELRE